MQLEHEFVVPVPPGQAWAVLLDVERIAPCMPGATLESVDADSFGGTVKVKLGPIQVAYRGTARFVEKDESARRAVIDAKGRETRGAGTVVATIRATLREEGAGSTRVVVATDLNITGKPAQFGRGVMADVGSKIIGQFAACLADEITADATAASAPAGPQPVDGPPPGTDAPAVAPEGPGPVPAPPATRPAHESPPPPVRPTPEAIDLLGTAGVPALKRLAPLAAALLAVMLGWRALTRRRR